MENQNRTGKVLLILAGLAVALCVGMTIGGLLVYGVMRISDLKSSRAEIEHLEMPFEEFHKEDLDKFYEKEFEKLPVPEVASGAIISEVLPDTPAEQAGLQEGDVVVAVDSQRVGPAGNLARLIRQYEPGDRVTLTVRRGDKEPLKIRVKLGEHPEEPGAPHLGVIYQPASPQGMMLRELPPLGEGGMWRLDEIPMPLPGGPERPGVMVISVAEGSPAADAGLEHGDLVVSLDGDPVGSAEAFGDAIAARQPGDAVVLSVLRHGDQDEVEIKVRLGEHPEQPKRAYLGVRIGDVFRHFHGLWEEGEWMPHDEMPFNWDDLRRRFELQPPPADEGGL
jgi:S1-C subfamily serine protease